MSLDAQIFLGVGLGILFGTASATVLYFRSLSRLRRNPPRCVQRTLGNTAVICSWCPDKPAGDAWAKRLDLMPSHTICPGCRDQYFPNLKRR